MGGRVYVGALAGFGGAGGGSVDVECAVFEGGGEFHGVVGWVSGLNSGSN